jgi:hypothetical protein
MAHRTSRIRAVRFDRATRVLRVEYEDGAAYDYADVPEHLYDELSHTPDRDTFFRTHIRDEFTGTRAGDVDLAEVAQERREDAVLGAPLAEGAEDAASPSAGREMSDTDPAVRHGERHTWVVDVLDDDAAAVEVDGRRITPIPRWLLPADARDGDVLRVTHARSGTRSTLSIEVDPVATQTAYRRSAEQMRDVPSGGTGDIDLAT